MYISLSLSFSLSLSHTHTHNKHPVKVSEKLYEAAADCVCSALYICEDLTKFGPLATTLQHHVHQLVPIYIASIETEDTDRLD